MRSHLVPSNERTGLIGVGLSLFRPTGLTTVQTQCSKTDREGIARHLVAVGCKANWHRKAIGDRIGARRRRWAVGYVTDADTKIAFIPEYKGTSGQSPHVSAPSTWFLPSAPTPVIPASHRPSFIFLGDAVTPLLVRRRKCQRSLLSV